MGGEGVPGLSNGPLRFGSCSQRGLF